MGKVFISYRRQDAAGYARAIYEELTERFTPDRIFMDVDAIEPGLPFDEVIRNAVGQCEALLVLIGSRWLAPQPDGRTRLEDERDFVRLEIAAALARNIRVIPVLLDGTPMPREAELPEALRGLVWRNAIELSNTRFTADVNRLAEVLAKVLGDGDKAPPASAAGATIAASPPPSSSALTSATVKSSSATAGAQSATAEPEPRLEQTARAGERPGGRRLDAKILAGVLGAAVMAAVVALWPDRTPSTVTKDLPGNAPPRLALALPAYGVVFGSDKTIEAARDAAEQLGLTAKRLKSLGLVDKVVREPIGGAHRNPRQTATRLKAVLMNELDQLEQLPVETLLQRRYERLRSYGAYEAA